MALRLDGVLKTAVTSTAVGGHSFSAKLIEAATLNARIVVLDCNLAVDQMSLLLDYARRHNRPTVVAAVSDSKVVRLLQLEEHQLIDVVVLNELELQAVIAAESTDNNQNACKLLRAKRVVVTAGASGYRVLSEYGKCVRYSAPQMDKIASQTGAGDALLSGIVTYWYRNQNLDFDDALPTIATSVRRVLAQPGATAGSLATDIDFSLLARIAIRNEPVWKRFLSPEVGVATTIFVALLTVALLILTFALLPPANPKSVPTTSGKAVSLVPLRPLRDRSCEGTPRRARTVDLPDSPMTAILHVKARDGAAFRANFGQQRFDGCLESPYI